MILFLKKFVVNTALILSIITNAQTFQAVLHWQNYCAYEAENNFSAAIPEFNYCNSYVHDQCSQEKVKSDNNCSRNTIERDHFNDFTRDQRMQEISDNEATQFNNTRSTGHHQAVIPANSHYPSHITSFDRFVPVDVENITVTALNNNSTYSAIAFDLIALTDRVLDNAKLYNLDSISDIEIDVHDAINNIRMPRSNGEFIFNVAIVDHLLNNIQNRVNSIIKGYRIPLKRSSELLARALEKFIARLNPVNQVTDMCSLATSAAHLSTNALRHPIDTAGKIFTVTKKSCMFLINTACFAADLAIGKYYLSPDEYQQRIDSFWQTINVPLKRLNQLTAENCVDLAAHLAADFIFCKSVGTALIYLKEIDAAGKAHKYAAAITRKFKQAVDIHLTDNPILVTTEGIALKASHDMKQVGTSVKEIITDSRMLIESATTGLLHKAKQEIEQIKKLFDCPQNCVLNCAKKGFNEFKNKHIKIPYEHIFGMELRWSKKGSVVGISGFHHDFMGEIENSDLFKFIYKKIEPNGCYLANIIVDGSPIRDKTFFPKHWSREKVISKIYEAYENFIKSETIAELTADGKYHLKALTNESIKIEIYITQSGHVKTAYPIIK